MSLQILEKTESLCPSCLKRIKANVVIKNNKTLIYKKCQKHGEFECFHAWDDPFIYKKFMKIFKKHKNFERDVTIDITSRCNMNCPFCFSPIKGKFYEPDIWQILKKSKSWGQGTISLCGGEPTLRKDIFEIIKKIKTFGLEVCILTNGIKLTKEYVKKLEFSGLDRIILQFDSLDDKINLKMRNQKLVKYKLDAIENLEDTKIPVTLFVVLAKNHNETQIEKIISFASKKSDKILTVIFCPVSPEGAENNFRINYLSSEEIFKIIEENFGIKKEDFVECTEFDVTLSNFLYMLNGTKRRSVSPCEAMCYVIVKNSNPTSLNRLVELKKISKILEELIMSKYESNTKILLSFFVKCVRNKVRIRASSVPFLSRVFLSLLFSSITHKKLKNKFKGTFGIMVNPTQNRYNIDYNFIEKCNLFSNIEESNFISFCEKNILSTGPKKMKSLNYEMISKHKK